MFLKPLHVVLGHLRYHLDIEPAVAVDKVLHVPSLHLHLGVQLFQEHLPLVLVAQAMNHLRYAYRLAEAVVRAGHHTEHLCHDPTTEQAAVRYVALSDNRLENRVVVIQDGQPSSLVGGDIFAAVGALHGEKVAHVHADGTERLDAFLRCFGQVSLLRWRILSCGFLIRDAQPGIFSDNDSHYCSFLVRDSELRPALGTRNFCLFLHTIFICCLLS
ncbi:MAG: hypothetical protein MEBIL_04180 [Bilophila sp.]